MEVVFRTRRLERAYTDYKRAERDFGPEVARRYIERINIIKSAKDIDELRDIRVLKCHPLKGNRKGEWAVNLTGFYRLIFTLQGEKLEIAHIEEVSKHYGD